MKAKIFITIFAALVVRLDDDKHVVRYTASAAIIRLSDMKPRAR